MLRLRQTASDKEKTGPDRLLRSYSAYETFPGYDDEWLVAVDDDCLVVDHCFSSSM
jgi:hypothetical protein